MTNVTKRNERNETKRTKTKTRTKRTLIFVYFLNTVDNRRRNQAQQNDGTARLRQFFASTREHERRQTHNPTTLSMSAPSARPPRLRNVRTPSEIVSEDPHVDALLARVQPTQPFIQPPRPRHGARGRKNRMSANFTPFNPDVLAGPTLQSLHGRADEPEDGTQGDHEAQAAENEENVRKQRRDVEMFRSERRTAMQGPVVRQHHGWKRKRNSDEDNTPTELRDRVHNLASQQSPLASAAGDRTTPSEISRRHDRRLNHTNARRDIGQHNNTDGRFRSELRLTPSPHTLSPRRNERVPDDNIRRGNHHVRHEAHRTDGTNGGHARGRRADDAGQQSRRPVFSRYRSSYGLNAEGEEVVVVESDERYNIPGSAANRYASTTHVDEDDIRGVVRVDDGNNVVEVSYDGDDDNEETVESDHHGRQLSEIEVSKSWSEGGENPSRDIIQGRYEMHDIPHLSQRLKTKGRGERYEVNDAELASPVRKTDRHCGPLDRRPERRQLEHRSSSHDSWQSSYHNPDAEERGHSRMIVPERRRPAQPVAARHSRQSPRQRIRSRALAGDSNVITRHVSSPRKELPTVTDTCRAIDSKRNHRAVSIPISTHARREEESRNDLRARNGKQPKPSAATDDNNVIIRHATRSREEVSRKPDAHHATDNERHHRAVPLPISVRARREDSRDDLAAINASQSKPSMANKSNRVGANDADRSILGPSVKGQPRLTCSDGNSSSDKRSGLNHDKQPLEDSDLALWILPWDESRMSFELREYERQMFKPDPDCGAFSQPPGSARKKQEQEQQVENGFDSVKQNDGQSSKMDDENDGVTEGEVEGASDDVRVLLSEAVEIDVGAERKNPFSTV